MLGLAAGFDQQWLAQGSRFVIAAIAVVTLVAAANSTMLGLSRLAYSLSTHRQIPSALGRLHSTRFTPWVLIVLATIVAIALAVPGDLLLLLNVYAFGAMLGLTIAHASIVRLRITEPDRPRPRRVDRFTRSLGKGFSRGGQPGCPRRPNAAPPPAGLSVPRAIQRPAIRSLRGRVRRCGF